ncbi:MAG: carboxylating nicotinate-nucleotide diphosphorylase [Planctomycetota bacterium]|nr:MAG: carboxylating nicotinate-nucleotide diphosphorylase [Planctomycetota bacterium]
MSHPIPPFDKPEIRQAKQLILMALDEDLGTTGDITSLSTIPEAATSVGRFVARRDGIISGLPIIGLIAEQFQPGIQWKPFVSDGDRVSPGEVLGEVRGQTRSILALERISLNFLQRLSGIATMTSRFVEKTAGTKSKVLDTRKTTPGWRALEKYAVRCGNGHNHRIGLHDAILIKDNHLAALVANGCVSPITEAVQRARVFSGPKIFVTVEVDHLGQLPEALNVHPDCILLDNFTPEMAGLALKQRDALAPGVLLEISGGLTIDKIAEFARLGIDRLSVGALTHSAPALDIALDFPEMLSDH